MRTTVLQTNDVTVFYNRYSLFIVLLLIVTLPLNAQEKSLSITFKKDFFKVFDSSSKKLIDLSKAIPAEDYDWRPAENILSIKEALKHVSKTNYYLASKLGLPIPEKVQSSNSFKSVETKQGIQDILSKSIVHIRKAIQNINDEQLYTKVNFWGNEETMQRIILQAGEHMAEHLGQLIAYARMNGVTPPWSK